MTLLRAIPVGSCILATAMFALSAGCGGDDDGSTAEAESRAFADAHWHGDYYVQGLKQSFYLGTVIEGTDDEHLDTLKYRWNTDEQGNYAQQSLPHHAFYKNGGSRVSADEYYENIGNYDQFNFGWDDYRDSLIAAFGSSDISAVPMPTNVSYSGPGGGQRYSADSAKLSTRSHNRGIYLKLRQDVMGAIGQAVASRQDN